MKHLSTDQIISFVSFTELSQSNIQLATYVNSHMLVCEECRKKVTAFQTVYEELGKIHTDAIIGKSLPQGDLTIQDIQALKKEFIAKNSLVTESKEEN